MIVSTLVIVGVGLIGGSVGLAAKKRGIAKRIIGVEKDFPSLEAALAAKVIDEGSLNLAPIVKNGDLVVFASPVDIIADQILIAAPFCKAGVLLTDTGSTKGNIVRTIEAKLPNGVSFVGSHPLAGSEKRGPEHSTADLFQDRVTVVTQTRNTDSAAVEKVSSFWQALGSRVRIMDPEEHDRAVALTSHLPHLLASALAGILPPELHELTATGFRDTTRIAGGDPALWAAIFSQNRTALLEALKLFSSRLAEFQNALETDNISTLDSLLLQAKKVRDALEVAPTRRE